MRSAGWRKTPGTIFKITSLLLLAVCYLWGVRAYLRIPDSPAASVLLSSACPTRSQVMEILEAEEQADLPTDCCFFYNGGIVSLQNENLGRQTDVLAAGLLGKAALYDWRCQGLSEDDREGCILDRETARLLFGSQDAAGGTVQLGDRTLTVRKTADFGQRMIVFWPSEKESTYTQVFVRPGTGESKKSAAQKFLMRHGLSGTLAEDSPWKPAAFIFLLTLPVLLVFRLFGAAFRERKAFTRKEPGYYIWTGAALVLAAGVGFLIWRNVRIPGDWIPGSWSDFEFWGERIQEWSQQVRWYLMMPKTVWQAETAVQALKVIALALFSLLLYMFFIKRKE